MMMVKYNACAKSIFQPQMTDYFRPQERNILFRRIEGITAETRSLDTRVGGHELICHFNNSLREICGLQRATSTANVVQRTLYKWLVFHVTPWPERTPRTPQALRAFIGSKPLATFEADHDELVELLKTFEQKCQEGSLPPHPVFGALSRDAWGHYMFLHLDYHLTTFGIHGNFHALK